MDGGTLLRGISTLDGREHAVPHYRRRDGEGVAVCGLRVAVRTLRGFSPNPSASPCPACTAEARRRGGR